VAWIIVYSKTKNLSRKNYTSERQSKIDLLDIQEIEKMLKNMLERRYPENSGYAGRIGTNVQSILPPHMLKELAKSGDESQREMALKHLMISEKIRGRREAFGEFYVSTPVGVKSLNVYDAKNGQSLPGDQCRIPITATTQP
jgi:hypothetical protein